MNIYVISMIVTLITAFIIRFVKWSEKQKRNLFPLFVFILWGSIMAFRDTSVGTDTLNYSNIFQTIVHSNWTDLVQTQEFRKFPLYCIYNKLIGIISDSKQWIIFCNSFIYMFGIILFIKKESKNYIISFILFLCFHFYFYAMNASRQSIAMMLIMWAFYFSKNGKKKQSIILLISAVFIHAIAIIGIIYLITTSIIWNRRKVIFACVIVCVLLMFVSILANLFAYIFPEYYDYVKADGVFSFLNMNNSHGSRIFISLYISILLLYCIYLRKRKIKYRLISRKSMIYYQTDQQFYQLLVLSFIAILWTIILRRNDLFARVEYIFSYTWMISIPYCIETTITNKNKRIIYLVTILFLLIPFYFKLDDYLPYIIGNFYG